MMFIIAEIGSNFDTLDDCLISIREAKRVGADACKFQLFSSEELYGFLEGREMEYAMPRSWIPTLAKYADEVGIEFMCTAFSVEGLRYIDPYVKRHKIASSDMEYYPLLDVARETGKPLIISTGGHNNLEISAVVKEFRGYDATFLYCESSYPANNIDLHKLSFFVDRGVPFGLSDHSREIYSNPFMALRTGCSVLEKHANFCAAEGPDSPHSLDVYEFGKMVEALRGKGSTELYSGEEADMRLRHNRRPVAKRDIAYGELLQYEVNFGLYRLLDDRADTLLCSSYKTLENTPATKAYKAGDPI